ncbi:MAG: hypothetical protein JNK15_14125 [Planctomycetes bacterium]|nr:hypothetical protein [Planctomycetota bacterium]
MIRSHLVHGAALLGLASAAAAQITVSSNITTSTTWTNNNVYALSGDIYVEPGATLTIQAGTVIASLNNSTLAVCRGAQIIANGTATSPIIFTSDNDRATWTADNPQTGTYRQLANNEWGNVTIMGSGYISENQIAANTAAPSASNYADMEGLSPAVTSLNDYGGGNDNDDSGSFSYVSLRYGGRTAAVGIELNGLSLGGIGRNTEIHHIEILNNLDDGIEVWGGTVNLKYLSIWNIGDDSLDLDQGWRGKAQFGLIVQGYSGTGTQGSGFGDNAIEVDGAELCHYQPVTTASVYNMTVIGSPHPTNGSTGGDHLTAWRDNANVQFRNCIFMDAGDNVINNDVTDGENGNTGYGCNSTLTWAQRWTTSFSTTSPVNPFANPAAAYTAQVNGNLIDFRDNVFFNNLRSAAYTEANTRLVFAGGGGTNNANNSIVTSSPITQITRGAAVTPNGTHTTSPVTFLDPTPANDALTAVEFAPADGFFSQARFRGAFKRGNNWLIGWTGTSAFGLTSNSRANVDLDGERAGLVGMPVHHTTGTWAAGTPVTLSVDNIDPNLNIGICVFGGFQFNLPIFGGVLVPTPDSVNVVVGAAGQAALGSFVIPPGLSGLTFYTQWASFDLGVPSGEFAFSNAQSHTLP